ncbi:RsmE family RNA methyltransferase [Ferruginibacter sp. SUN002]|uniref:RsmE family RNA methyltransferase n=1 Tax=Ferruginibacter sp. SUN002 TaxID=2937789 RepID=UPI003D35CCF9
MALPFFYSENIIAGQNSIALNEETSKHIVQVLRMQNGEQLQLTDGKGNLFTAEIVDNNKKACSVRVLTTDHRPPAPRKVTIAISLVKNTSRFEWFLEKATEIGVTAIVPLLCTRTEKQHFRFDRMKTILVSAMLQSQQVWLPLLHEPTKFVQYVQQPSTQQRFIAHCIEDDKQQLSHLQIPKLMNQQICIGPEGDFTQDEIDVALQNKYIPVALGNTRLRTETAGIVAATLLVNR